MEICSYLDHNTDDTLNAHDENALGALLGRVTGTVTDCMLCLDAEKETWCESVYIGDTRLPTCSVLISFFSHKIKTNKKKSLLKNFAKKISSFCIQQRGVSKVSIAWEAESSNYLGDAQVPGLRE